jgi:lysophospholipase L1-like esterase
VPIVVLVALAALIVVAAGLPVSGAARERSVLATAGAFTMLALDPDPAGEPRGGRTDRDATIVEPPRTVTGGAARSTPLRPDVVVPDAPVIESGTVPGRGSTAVYLGDSYTSGWAGAGLGARGWPRLVGAERGWRTLNLAVPGTGFLNPGWTGQPIGSRVAAAIAARPDVVVLAGGHNDSRWAADATARAAESAIDRLRAALPEALLVVVAPIWQDGSAPQRCRALRDRLRARAASVGAVFIDPLASGWFAGSSHRFIGLDGIHPTNAGHRFIADRVLAALDG